jgi:hypothetical protein
MFPSVGFVIPVTGIADHKGQTIPQQCQSQYQPSMTFSPSITEVKSNQLAGLQ